MKTVKRLAAALLLTISMATFANDLKANDLKETVTITEDNKLVEVSVLNTEAANYELTIYGPSGEEIYSGELGNDVSLGKVFDFNNARKGIYTFKFSTSEGKQLNYKVNTGIRF